VTLYERFYELNTKGIQKKNLLFAKKQSTLFKMEVLHPEASAMWISEVSNETNFRNIL